MGWAMILLKASSHSLWSCSCSHLKTNCLVGVWSQMPHCQRPPLMPLLVLSETEYSWFSVPMKTAPNSTASCRIGITHEQLFNPAFDFKNRFPTNPGIIYQWSFIIYKLSVHWAQCEPPLLEWFPLLKAHKHRESTSDITTANKLPCMSRLLTYCRPGFFHVALLQALPGYLRK